MGHRGAPDRKILHPVLGCWAELKAPGKPLDEHQEREISRMILAGETVEVFDTKEKIDEWVLRKLAGLQKVT